MIRELASARLAPLDTIPVPAAAALSFSVGIIRACSLVLLLSVSVSAHIDWKSSRFRSSETSPFIAQAIERQNEDNVYLSPWYRRSDSATQR